MELKNLDKGALKEAIKEILAEEKTLMREIFKEMLMEYNIINPKEDPTLWKKLEHYRQERFSMFDDVIKALT